MDKMEQIVSLCKRRGFIYPSADIYGGLRGFWDYGPLGARLKKNIRDAWWKDMITATPVDPVSRQPLTIVPLEGSIITNAQVWKVSGHADTFADIYYTCPACSAESREDAWNPPGKAVTCPACKKEFGPFILNTMASRRFDLMFKSEAGVVEGDKYPVYLRPETAQSIFVNFNNVLKTNRLKLPFGIAQIGKAFRNEVTPRHFTFRSREFEQMEIEWFYDGSNVEQSNRWFGFWLATRMEWWYSLGLTKLKPVEQSKEDLAHYAKNGVGTMDLHYEFPWGYEEIEGIAHRTDYDLRRHSEASGVDMQYFDEESEKKFFPHVLEPSAGLDRAALAILCEAYTYDEKRPCKEFMKIEPRIAPIKLAFFPLVNKGGMPEMAINLYNHYRRKYDCVYDAKQTVGKRYARMDEIGTPFCITIDGETLTNDTVTVRFRDTMEQKRVELEALEAFFAHQLG